MTKLLKEFIDKTQCPIDWPNIAQKGICILRHELIEYWCEIVGRHQVDGEVELIHEIIDVPYEEIDKKWVEEFYPDINVMLINIEEGGIIQRATDEFNSLCKPLLDMKMATDKDQQKHFCSENIPIDQIRERTKGKPPVSLFYPGVQSKLDSFMWDVFYKSDIWKRIIEEDNFRKIYVDCKDRIGASQGLDTEYICLIVNCSTPISHAYPVNKSDVDGDSIFVDTLIGVVDNR